MFFAREPNCRGASRILGYPLRTMVGGIESLLFSVALEKSESGPVAGQLLGVRHAVSLD